MNKNIHMEIITVTPVMAQRYLERNDTNRSVTKSRVDNYVTQIRNGDWVINGETIIISESGQLLNGQHRLAAVVKSGVNVDMMFIFNIDKDNFDTIDSGKNRGAGDILAINGMPKSLASMVAVAAKTNLKYKNTGVLNAQMSGLLTPAHVADEAESDGVYTDAAKFINSYGRHFMHISKGRLCFLVYRFFKIDRAFTEEWLHGFITGEDLHSGDYRMWIRDRFIKDSTATRKMSKDDRDYLVIKAWHYAMMDRVVTSERSFTASSDCLRYLSGDK